MISLVYDSLAVSDLEWVLPDLQAADVYATFFVHGELITNDIAAWKRVAGSGHKLGNGAVLAITSFLEQMQPADIADEIDDLNILIREVAGSEAVIPTALPSASGRLDWFSLATGELVSVVAVGASAAPALEAARERASGPDPVILAFHQPHPQAHKQVLDWLAEHSSGHSES